MDLFAYCLYVDHTCTVTHRQGTARAALEPRSTRVAEHASRTQASLVDAARGLFASQGYFATTTEEIVRAAGLTRGSLYHHFSDKKALFLAVFVVIQQELQTRSRGRPAPDSARERLESGLLGFLQASTTPEIQQVILIDGPAVLGWQVWRGLEADYGLGAIRGLLEDAVDEGAIEQQPLDALAHILLAAVDEAALFIANAADPQGATESAVSAMKSLLKGLTMAAR